LHFLVDVRERSLAGRAFAQQHDARHDIVVIDDFAVLAVKGSRKLTRAESSDLAKRRKCL